jgi:uncharacterized protein with ParB-like and HNH nuclease domain
MGAKIVGFQSDKIVNIMNRLNTRYFLPDMQREYVWHQEHVMKLFDSIMRGYPIGSFLFWDLEFKDLGDFGIYYFTVNYKEGNHLQEAFVKNSQLILVLDGQQRLTSLLIGLRGSYTIKKKYSRHDNFKAWVEQQLYLDLLQNPASAYEYGDVDRIYYGFKFFAEPPENDKDHFWFRVGDILGFDEECNFEKFKVDATNKLQDNVSDDQKTLFQVNLSRLYSAICKDDVISYYVETNPNYDRAMDIFIRTNDGGIKLTKSDILLSMFISKWEDIKARKEIYDFVDGLNIKNNFNKDLIMKTCLVLSDLPVRYEFSNFNRYNLKLMATNWNGIKDAIDKAVELSNSFGIGRNTLTSKNALIPIIYYIYKHPNTKFYKSIENNVENVKKIRIWLTAALINNVFGGQSDRILTEIRKVLQENHVMNDFPVVSLNKKLRSMGRNTEFNEETINKILKIKYRSREAFLALSLLYDRNDLGTIIKIEEQDHIFSKDRLMKEIKESANDLRRQMIKERMHCIGNLELLNNEEHADKVNNDFAKWISSRKPEFKERHLIPFDESLYSIDKFDEFIEERNALIRTRLENLFSTMTDV